MAKYLTSTELLFAQAIEAFDAYIYRTGTRGRPVTSENLKAAQDLSFKTSELLRDLERVQSRNVNTLSKGAGLAKANPDTRAWDLVADDVQGKKFDQATTPAQAIIDLSTTMPMEEFREKANTQKDQVHAVIVKLQGYQKDIEDALKRVKEEGFFGRKSECHEILANLKDQVAKEIGRYEGQLEAIDVQIATRQKTEMEVQNAKQETKKAKEIAELQKGAINQLTTQNATLVQQNENLIAQMDSVQKQAKVVQENANKTLEAANKKLSESQKLVEENKNLQKTIETKAQDVHLQNVHLKRLEDKLESAKKDSTYYKDLSEKQEVRIKEYAEENIALERENDALKKENESLKARLKVTEERMNEYKSKYEVLLDKFTKTFGTFMDAVKSVFGGSTKEANVAEQAITQEMKKKQSEVMDAIQQANDKLPSYQSENEMLKKENAKLQQGKEAAEKLLEADILKQKQQAEERMGKESKGLISKLLNK